MTNDKPSALLVIGFIALPVVVVLTTYLDVGAWLFASTRAALLAGAAAGMVIGLVSWLLHDRVHGSLVGLCLLVALVVYQYPGVTLLLLLVAGLIAANALRGPGGSRAASRLFGIVYRAIGVFGIALLLVTLVQFGLRGQITGFDAKAAVAEPNPDAPDIWLVLLDGYPRTDILEREWGHDGPSLADDLEDLGFIVSDEARSNYNMTKLTLAALFDMALLKDVEPWSGYEKPIDAPVVDRVLATQDNRAFGVLRDHGYRLTSISAGYRQEDIRAVDEFIDAGAADVVELLLLGRTAIGALIQAIDPRFAEHQVGGRVEANLEALTRLADEPSERPRFVFAHLPAPHPPYAFATSEFPTLPLGDVSDYHVDLLGEELLRTVYLEHLAGLGERVTDRLAAVVDSVGDDAVIIVMSDHGPRPGGYEGLTPKQAAAQFSILLAARTPDGEPLFEQDAVATDVLSTVANRYLGTDIPPVERIFEANDGVRYPE